MNRIDQTFADCTRAVEAAEQHHDRETALQQCSQAAAEEIYSMTSSEFKYKTKNQLAAIIYKHMRYGREL